MSSKENVMLSKKAREILTVAMANAKAAKEVADAIDAADQAELVAQIEDLQDQIDAIDARVTALEEA